MRPYTVDPHNIFAFHRTDAYRVRPSFCASPVRLFQSTERLYRRNAMRPPLGSLVASMGRPPLGPRIGSLVASMGRPPLGPRIGSLVASTGRPPLGLRP